MLPNPPCRRDAGTRLALRLSAGAALAMALALTLRDARATSPQAGTFVVTSTEDTEDVQWGDGACGDTLGRCTLRGAIQEANAHEGADAIRFHVGASRIAVIKPDTPLPVVFDETTIDGTSQPYYTGIPLILLEGTDAGTGADGIVLAGDASAIKGLAITGFDGIGVVVTDNDGSRLEASYVGVGLDGRTAVGNRGHGVHLLRARNAVIGGTDVSLRNVISGNGGNGVHIEEVGSRGNRVVGNFIGVDADGVIPVPNRVDGVSIENAPENFVGGSDAGAVNLIAGNLDDGVEIVGPGAYSNTVQANWIGTGVDGVTALGHNDAGVLIAGATDNLVIGNVLAGNGGFGLELGPQTRGNRAVANYVGTNPTGDPRLGNGAGGIGIREGAANVVGEEGLPNRVAGNRGPGILLAGTRASGNRVEGNEIGRLGETVLPNSGFGVVVRDGARENQIFRNTATDGLRVWGQGTDANELEANEVASANGVERLEVGIEVGPGPRNTDLDHNSVSGTGRVGILVQGSGTDGTLIQGGTVQGASGAGIVVDDFAGPTSITGGHDPEDVLAIRDTTPVAVELHGTGRVLYGVEITRGAVGVEVHGEGHQIDVRARALSGPAVSVLEGAGHSVSLNTTDVGAPAIDLGGDGATVNDTLDLDRGPNGLLNHPELRQVRVTGVVQDGKVASTDVVYAGAPGIELQLEVYAVEGCREGEQPRSVRWAGSGSLSTDAEGRASKVVTGITVPADAAGLAVTATDSQGSTSELSGCVPLTLGRVYLPATRTD